MVFVPWTTVNERLRVSQNHDGDMSLVMMNVWASAVTEYDCDGGSGLFSLVEVWKVYLVNQEVPKGLGLKWSWSHSDH